MASLPANPFTEWTYRERRALLGLSVGAIAITRLGLVPDSIPPMGIHDLAGAQREGLVTLLLVVTFYFLVMFLLYATSDFLKWRADIKHEELVLMAEQQAGAPNVSSLAMAATVPKPPALIEQTLRRRETIKKQKLISEAKKSHWFLIGTPVFWFRVSTDAGLPLGIGLYALWCLWHWTPQ